MAFPYLHFLGLELQYLFVALCEVLKCLLEMWLEFDCFSLRVILDLEEMILDLGLEIELKTEILCFDHHGE